MLLINYKLYRCFRLDSLVMLESGDTSDTYCDDVLTQTSRRGSRHAVESLPYLTSLTRSLSDSMLSLHTLASANTLQHYQQVPVSSLDDLVSETAIRHNGTKCANLCQTLSVSAENLLFVWDNRTKQSSHSSLLESKYLVRSTDWQIVIKQNKYRVTQLFVTDNKKFVER